MSKLRKCWNLEQKKVSTCVASSFQPIYRVSYVVYKVYTRKFPRCLSTEGPRLLFIYTTRLPVHRSVCLRTHLTDVCCFRDTWSPMNSQTRRCVEALGSIIICHAGMALITRHWNDIIATDAPRRDCFTGNDERRDG